MAEEVSMSSLPISHTLATPCDTPAVGGTGKQGISGSGSSKCPLSSSSGQPGVCHV